MSALTRDGVLVDRRMLGRCSSARQALALAFVIDNGRTNSRALAGALDMRSQDAGRVLANLERAGLVRFAYGDGRAGYEVTT